ncbi:hypothetical protein KY289_023907 [Solanum tuberosum]|nr:hypothetical protein KY289_023907 [Solanum tuberosum]
MVPISSKGKEKYNNNYRKAQEKKLGNVLVEIPDTDVMDVSIEDSEHEGVEKSSEEMGKKVKKPSTGKSQGKEKSKTSVAKRVVSKKGKNKRKRETSPVIKPASGTGHGPLGNDDDHGGSQQSIVNNLRL